MRDERLTDTQIRVLCAIGTFTNKLGGNVWASVPTLAKQSSLSTRSVQRALPHLVACGYVTRIERPGRTNLYEIVLTQPVVGGDCAVTPPMTPESPKRPNRTTPLLTEQENKWVNAMYEDFPKRDTPHAYIPARNAIIALTRSGVPIARMAQAVAAYRDKLVSEQTEPRYVKSCHGFFSDGYWLAYDAVRVYGRTRQQWAASGQDVAEFDRIAALSNASDDDGEPDEGV